MDSSGLSMAIQIDRGMDSKQELGGDTGQQVHVYTSAALNYLPKVRTLFSSLRRHHPEWKLHLLVADEIVNARIVESEIGRAHV